MADFYDSIRDNLENQPEPEFNPADWEDMKERIQEQPRRPLPIFWWSAAAFLLLFLGSNAWWYVNSSPSTEVTEIKEKTVYIYDTIVKKEIVYQIDTVIRYRNRPINTVTNQNFSQTKKALEALAFQQEVLAGGIRMQAKKDFFNQNFNDKNLLSRTTDALRNESFSSSPIDENLLVILKEGNSKNQSSLDLLPFNFTPLTNKNIVFTENFTPAPSVEKEDYRRRLLLETWRNVQPTGVFIAAEGGYTYPLGVGVEDKIGYMTGIKSGVTFSPALRLLISGNYQYITYQTDNMGEEIGVPVISPPSDDLVFQQADVIQSSLQFAVSLQYLFRARKKLKPYIGFGFGSHSLLPAEIKYTFVNPDDLELIAEYDVERQGWEAGDIHLQTGLEFRLSEHWNIPLGVNYIFNPEADTPQVLQIKAGVNYHF